MNTGRRAYPCMFVNEPESTREVVGRKEGGGVGENDECASHVFNGLCLLGGGVSMVLLL